MASAIAPPVVPESNEKTCEPLDPVRVKSNAALVLSVASKSVASTKVAWLAAVVTSAVTPRLPPVRFAFENLHVAHAARDV